MAARVTKCTSRKQRAHLILCQVQIASVRDPVGVLHPPPAWYLVAAKRPLFLANLCCSNFDKLINSLSVQEVDTTLEQLCRRQSKRHRRHRASASRNVSFPIRI